MLCRNFLRGRVLTNDDSKIMTSGFDIPNENAAKSTRRDELWFGFVIMLALVLLVTAIGRLCLTAAVYWVYGKAGYDSGIRIHFVGKAMRFSNGEPVSGSVSTATSLGALVLAVLVAYVVVFSGRWMYDRLSLRSKRRAA